MLLAYIFKIFSDYTILEVKKEIWYKSVTSLIVYLNSDNEEDDKRKMIKTETNLRTGKWNLFLQFTVYVLALGLTCIYSDFFFVQTET